MTQLFDRRCVVQIGKAPPNNFVQVVPDGLEIDGLRTTFKIVRDLKPEPNTCEIAVYNLSEDSRAQLTGKGFRCILSAGYAEEVAQIFTGDVRFFDHRREEVDWVTVLQLGDGERAFNFARIAESFGPGIDVKQVLTKAIKAVAQDPGNALQKIAGLTGQFVNGYVAQGRASLELSRLLEPYGYTWSVQDGRLEILEPDGYTADLGPLISPDTGLIGTPEISVPEHKAGRPIMHLRSLLLPRLRPGQRFELRSEKKRGTFRALKVTHFGDTFGNDWYTDVEAYA